MKLKITARFMRSRRYNRGGLPVRSNGMHGHSLAIDPWSQRLPDAPVAESKVFDFESNVFRAQIRKGPEDRALFRKVEGTHPELWTRKANHCSTGLLRPPGKSHINESLRGLHTAERRNVDPA
jgi:hypothetical protein